MEGFKKFKRLAAATMGLFGANMEQAHARELGQHPPATTGNTIERLENSFEVGSVGAAPISNVSFIDSEEPFGRGLLDPNRTFSDASTRPLDILRRDPPEDDRPEVIRPGVGFEDGITYTRENGDELRIGGNRRGIRFGYKKRF